jgi:outer membrane receptor protein involved in Fe transport
MLIFIHGMPASPGPGRHDTNNDIRWGTCMNKIRKPLAAAIASASLASSAGLVSLPALAQGGASTLEEVVVTARKREESLQEIPVAVSALSAEDMQNLALQDFDDIAKVTAGLVFDNDFSRTANRPVIRGQANILNDSGVAYFIDGVYVTGSIADYDLNDVQRFEVVKGPQSALYGRNTYAGAINIITKDPGDEVSGTVTVEGAEDSQYEVAASVRGPLIPGVLKGSLAARHYERGGIFDSSFDGAAIGEQKSQSLSGLLLWTPNERTDVRLRAYYSELDDGQPALYVQPATENNCFADNGSYYQGLGRYYCGTVAPRNPSSDYAVQAPNAGDRVDLTQLSLKVDYELNENWSLTSITGYNNREATQITEADYGPTNFQTSVFARVPLGPPPSPIGLITGGATDFTFSFDNDREDFSQELRLDYTSDRLRGSFGAYYFEEDASTTDNRQLPPNAAELVAASYGRALAQEAAACAANPLCLVAIPLTPASTLGAPSRNRSSSDLENSAVFGLLAFDLTEALTLTVEGRYQREKISQVAIAQTAGNPITNTTVSSETFSTFTPRITLDWKINENHMLYALYAEGTKPGGFNSAAAIEGGVPSFDEEDLQSFEVGSKSLFLDGQLRLNTALFYNELEGYQLTQNVQGAGEITSATVNAGDAEFTGLEVEALYRPAAAPGLTLTANYAYIDPEFTDGADLNQGLLNDFADDGLNNCSTGLQFEGAACSGDTVALGSIAGKQVPRTSKNTAFFDVEYRGPMGSGWEWFVGANYSYEESRFAQVLNYAETGDIELVNARLGFTSERYSINLWGKNLTGEDATPFVLRYADAGNSLKRNFVGTARRDTFFGITATMRF